MFHHELTESVSPHSTVKQTRATRRVFRRLQATIERSGGWEIDLNLVFCCWFACSLIFLEHCPKGFMYDIYLPMNLPFETWLFIDKCKGQYINIPSRHFLKARRIYDKLPRDHWCYVCLMRKTFSQSFRRRLNKFWSTQMTLISISKGFSPLVRPVLHCSWKTMKMATLPATSGSGVWNLWHSSQLSWL